MSITRQTMANCIKPQNRINEQDCVLHKETEQKKIETMLVDVVNSEKDTKIKV